MKQKHIFSKDFTYKIAKLSDLTITPKEEGFLTKQFNATLDTINTINTVNTDHIEGTYNVTGLSNVFREDIIEPIRILPREKTLQNAIKTYNGYFMVKGVLNEK